MYITLILLFAIILFTIWVLDFPVFGKEPKQERLHSIKKLPNYIDGEIKNNTYTPTKPDDVSYLEMIGKLIEGNKNGSPKRSLPHIRPNLAPSEDLKITWF